MKIALVGNQNSGKTTLFNLLTGMNQKIGNWPGVTIEKKTGIIKETNYEIVDLPGIYSLSPYSNEEKISANFIFEEKPDIIINIIDSTCLERSLYLTTQLLELDCKVIIALNMVDMLEKKGIYLDIDKLENELGTKICKISALKQIGINELIHSIKTLENKKKLLIYSGDLERGIMETERYLQIKEHKRFLAVKILENDDRFNKFSTYQIEEVVRKTANNYKLNLEEEIATERYNFISNLKRKSILQKKKLIDFTEILDKIFLNKLISIPIFFLIMFGVYFLSVGVVGKYTTDLVLEYIDKCSNKLEVFLYSINTSEWIISLIIDGMVKGVSTVLSFIPQLTILFLCISILETTGYMSRIAFLADKMFRKIGISGKALIPFIVGSGCSVPGIMGTRIIENEDERKMTSILVPFIPCSAKVPIIALFTGYFFGDNSGLVSGSMYLLSIVIIILSAIIMKKYAFKNITSSFISELPDYKMPNMKYLIKDVMEKIISFVARAGSTILLCSMLVWFLLSFSPELEYGISIEKSILALIGKRISWIFYPIVGTNSWEIAVSSIQGLIAKEQVISSLSIIAGFNENTPGYNGLFETGGVFGFFNQASSYAFVIFNLFSAPCFNAIVAMGKELKSFKGMIKAVLFQTLIAWIVASIIYNVGSLFIR
ncbi:MAG: ferrous iron transport protein B [Clostridia bacterium]|nr:ferrous iron transport protein B [Clostridia bacterium]